MRARARACDVRGPRTHIHDFSSKSSGHRGGALAAERTHHTRRASSSSFLRGIARPTTTTRTTTTTTRCLLLPRRAPRNERRKVAYGVYPRTRASNDQSSPRRAPPLLRFSFFSAARSPRGGRVTRLLDYASAAPADLINILLIPIEKETGRGARRPREEHDAST